MNEVTPAAKCLLHYLLSEFGLRWIQSTFSTHANFQDHRRNNSLSTDASGFHMASDCMALFSNLLSSA